MINYLIEFLKTLEDAVPPPPACHHFITYVRYGSDETGWEDKLSLQINKDGEFLRFFLTEDDFAVSATVAAINVASYIKASNCK